MTEEEINKAAEKHCNEVLCNAHEKCNEVIKCRDWRSRRAGFFCGYEKALKDLGKENAELKTRVENQKSFIERIRAKFELGKLERKEIEGYLESEQLTKAKELLQKCINTYIRDPELRSEVEDFLKKVKK